MHTSHQPVLDTLKEDLQRRYGARALRRFSDPLPRAQEAVLSTGYPALDRALEIGGLPRRRLTELIGSGSAGHLSLAVSVLAQAQLAGLQTVYVDLAGALDPDLLVRRGVDLALLPVFRPSGLEHGLEMIRDLLAERGAGLVLVDRLALGVADMPDASADALLARGLREIVPLVDRAGALLLILTELPPRALYPSGRPLAYAASVRLACASVGWLAARGEIVGFSCRVTVVKHKLGPAGQSVTLRMGDAVTLTGETSDGLQEEAWRADRMLVDGGAGRAVGAAASGVGWATAARGGG